MGLGKQIWTVIILRHLDNALSSYSKRHCNGCEINHESPSQHSHLMEDRPVIGVSEWGSIIRSLSRDTISSCFTRVMREIKHKEYEISKINTKYEKQMEAWKNDTFGWDRNGLSDEIELNQLSWSEKVKKLRANTPYLNIIDRVHDCIVKETRWRYQLRIKYLQELLHIMNEDPEIPLTDVKKMIDTNAIMCGNGTIIWRVPYITISDLEEVLCGDVKTLIDLVGLYLKRERTISTELRDIEITLDVQHDYWKQICGG